MQRSDPSWRHQGLAVTVVLGLFVALQTTDAVAKDLAPGAQPQDFVEVFVAKADSLMPGAGPAAEDEGVEEDLRAFLLSGFDIETISRIVLDEHWDSASELERAEFRSLFESYLLTTYKRYLGGLKGGRHEILAARERGEKGAQVRSRMRGADGGRVFQVEWRLWRSDKAWRIVDVMVQGISMVKTYRSQFAALIGDGASSIDRLLSALRQKVAADAG